MPSVRGKQPNRLTLKHTHKRQKHGNSTTHLSRNYPIVSAGGRNLGFDNGRYLRYVKLLGDGSLPGAGVVSDSGWQSNATEEDRPLAHLFVTILQRFGVETDTFAGCTGTLEGV